MPYTEPKRVQAGETWDANRWNTEVVENIKALYALLSGGSSTGFRINQVLIGSTSGAPQGLTLTNGALIVGTNNAPTALPLGTPGQILVVNQGDISWITKDIGLKPVDVVKWGF